MLFCLISILIFDNDFCTKPKVSQLYVEVRINQKVLRLQVSMTKPLLKHIPESVQYLSAVKYCGFLTQVPGGYILVEIVIFRKVHDQVRTWKYSDGLRVQLLELTNLEVLNGLDVVQKLLLIRFSYSLFQVWRDINFHRLVRLMDSDNVLVLQFRKIFLLCIEMRHRWLEFLLLRELLLDDWVVLIETCINLRKFWVDKHFYRYFVADLKDYLGFLILLNQILLL